MSDVSTIVINDGATTPVAVTFSPEAKAPTGSIFTDRRSIVAAGWVRLKTALGLPSAKRRTFRASYEVEMPITQVVDGVISAAFTNRAQVAFVIDERSTVQNKKDLFAYVHNGLNHTAVKAMIVDGDPIY